MIIGSGSRRSLTHIDDPHIRIRFRRCFLQQWEKGCREDAGREVTGGNASWKLAMEAAVLLFMFSFYETYFTTMVFWIPFAPSV